MAFLNIFLVSSLHFLHCLATLSFPCIATTFLLWVCVTCPNNHARPFWSLVLEDLLRLLLVVLQNHWMLDPVLWIWLSRSDSAFARLLFKRVLVLFLSSTLVKTSCMSKLRMMMDHGCVNFSDKHNEWLVLLCHSSMVVVYSIVSKSCPWWWSFADYTMFNRWYWLDASSSSNACCL